MMLGIFQHNCILTHHMSSRGGNYPGFFALQFYKMPSIFLEFVFKTGSLTFCKFKHSAFERCLWVEPGFPFICCLCSKCFSRLSSFPSLCPLGVVSLSQALCSSDEYSNSLLHLDLSKNPGVLSGDDATVRKKHPHTFQFLKYNFYLLDQNMHMVCMTHRAPAFLFFLCRTCTFSLPNPTAWSTWTYLERTAWWTRFVCAVSLTLPLHSFL